MISLISTEIVIAIFTMISAIVAASTACYAIKQYKRHLQDEHTKLLCEYNYRYSNDSNIRTVIEWMLRVADTDEYGDINGVKSNCYFYAPGINTKELFMRFFEELNLQMEKKNLKSKEVFDLFAYYALRFHEYKDFRLDIDDYKTNEELNDISDDKTRKKMEYRWHNFRSFIGKMKEEENKLNKD